MISSSSGASPDLTTHVVTGEVRGEDLQRAAMAFLKDSPTRLALWDFTEAQFSTLTTQDLVAVFDSLVPYAEARRGGRSALLFSSTVGFGLGRLSEALAEVRDFPFELKAFGRRSDALLWLEIPIENGDPEEEDLEGEGAA